MPTITEVKLIGFQSHVKSHFQLGPGLNVVTGPSDAGKTSIIRAIRWVAFNEPQGEAFVNATVGEAVVTVSLDNGSVITKRRRKGKTSYLLQLTPDDEGSLYEKSEVPDEVKNILQIDKQRFGDFESSLNFAFQLDAPFLISETASAGAKILGKLAGTECVDLAIKGISKDTYAARQERANAEKDAERIAGSMLAFLGLDDAKNAVETAEIVIERVEETARQLEKLKDQRLQYETKTERLQVASERIEQLKDVPQLASMMSQLETDTTRLQSLVQASNSYKRLQDQIENLNDALTRYQDVEYVAEIVQTSQGAIERLEQLKTLKAGHDTQVVHLERAETVLGKTSHIEEIARSVKSIDQDILQASLLRMFSESFEANENRARQASERLQESANVVSEGTGTIERLSVNFERLNAFRVLADSYDARQYQVEQQTKRLNDATLAVVEAQNDEQAAWEEAGGICPLCGQPHEGGSHS